MFSQVKTFPQLVECIAYRILYYQAFWLGLSSYNTCTHYDIELSHHSIQIPNTLF